MTEPSQVAISGPTVLAVDGMTCGSCVDAVRRALSQVPDVERVEVERASGLAVVEGDARPPELISALNVSGFTASLKRDGGASSPPRSGGCCR